MYYVLCIVLLVTYYVLCIIYDVLYMMYYILLASPMKRKNKEDIVSSESWCGGAEHRKEQYTWRF